MSDPSPRDPDDTDDAPAPGNTPTLADMMGVPHTLELDGKFYDIRKPNLLEQAQFQRWMEDDAFTVIERMPEGSAKNLAVSAWVDKCGPLGYYEWGGEVAQASMLTIRGAAKLLSLIAKCDEKTAGEVIEQHRTRVEALFAAAVAEDPKALAAAIKTLGLPADILSPVYETRRSVVRKPKLRR